MGGVPSEPGEGPAARAAACRPEGEALGVVHRETAVRREADAVHAEPAAQSAVIFRGPISYLLQPEHWRKARLNRDAGDGKYRTRIIGTNPVAVEKRREHDLRLGHGKCRADASTKP